MEPVIKVVPHPHPHPLLLLLPPQPQPPLPLPHRLRPQLQLLAEEQGILDPAVVVVVRHLLLPQVNRVATAVTSKFSFCRKHF